MVLKGTRCGFVRDVCAPKRELGSPDRQRQTEGPDTPERLKAWWWIKFYKIGGWGVRPTGKSFRFVSCVRARGGGEVRFVCCHYYVASNGPQCGLGF